MARKPSAAKAAKVAKAANKAKNIALARKLIADAAKNSAERRFMRINNKAQLKIKKIGQDKSAQAMASIKQAGYNNLARQGRKAVESITQMGSNIAASRSNSAIARYNSIINGDPDQSTIIDQESVNGNNMGAGTGAEDRG